MTAPTSAGYRALSLWHDTLAASGDDDLTPRPGLDGDADVDVCIVGGGYTGLWTAYYLLLADPSLSVLVVEAEVAGFGASGRNGGWCSALFPASSSSLARRHGREAALAMRRAMNDTVTEVGRAAQAEDVDCHWAPGGTVRLARTEVQLGRARAELAEDARFDGVDGVELLTREEALAHVGATGVLGGTYTPHCARIHPARLVRGLARAVERRGGRIVERTRAMRIEPGTLPARSGANPLRDNASGPRVVTSRGTVRARHVVRATEAWTATLPGSARDVIPVYSLVVATEPLPASFWAGAGLAKGETFSDHRHLIVYGQRTADDRLVFGGRGAPYHRGSRIEPEFDREPEVFAGLRAAVADLFPAIRGHAFTHAWGGPLAIARDWHASVGLDRLSGVAWAGGYVGDGVGTANLAGRTLADLLTGRTTELTRLPWVGHRSPRWEPEPLRWLEVNAGLRTMSLADGEERLTKRGSLAARLLAPMLGH
ncbi:FAD-binding oxidoreductase [Kineosporia sp. A_224]|uniref:NAD(P)/FAD-dependent oxidoreductase n=1 Tax=Kineosporia sp. A_224 TaxID=1962180 RepID=UPI000B4A87C4|nr:FAD-binding oxidoreductase [Kineosporia sp. A_224]